MIAVDALIKSEIQAASADELAAYIRGACHDGTRSRGGTTRIGQKDLAWIEYLHDCIERAGDRAWIYREGRGREYWIVETSAAYYARRCEVPTSPVEVKAYVRGYFDAEGGIPRSQGARFYIQIAQKDIGCLSALHDAVRSLGIVCGDLHRPSRRVDPDYWRFAVRAAGHADFLAIVGSWHPRKRPLIERRLSQLSTQTR